MGNTSLWHSPRIRTLDEIEWERKESRRRRTRRLSLFFLYALILFTLVIG